MEAIISFITLFFLYSNDNYIKGNNKCQAS
jgi:hypothetical protein